MNKIFYALKRRTLSMHPGLRLRIRFIRSVARNVHAAIFGTFPRECPICGYHGRFLGMGLPQELDSVCPKCAAGPRHRFALLTMRTRNLFQGASVLHIAPEALVADWVRNHRAKSYLSGDLSNEADIVLDIERMDLGDSSFDAIICMHVLEHVNDELALGEMNRVLRFGGVAFVMVPIIEGWDETYENPNIISDAQRLLHFGQEDHVRYYGRDVRERLKRYFDVEEITASEPEVSRFGLLRGEKIFLCKKIAKEVPKGGASSDANSLAGGLTRSSS